MLRYDTGTGSLQDWILAEETFCAENVRKYESIMCQGNGYMGVRAAAEERYKGTERGTLVAGTFDLAEGGNSPELPASADVTAARVTADGREVRLDCGGHSGYLRELNLKNGLLRRSFRWESGDGIALECRFERFVSLEELHVMGERICLRVLEGSPVLAVETGIDGSETVHFVDGEAEAEDGIWQYAARTRESGIEFVTSAAVAGRTAGGETSQFLEGGMAVIPETELSGTGNTGTFRAAVSPGESLVIEKLVRIATSRDFDFGENGGLAPDARKHLLCREQKLTRELLLRGWEAAFAGSAAAWETLWAQRDVTVRSEDHFDQLVARFAVYHLTIMAPLHDNRMNIGAKGLSGRGYLGHTFWDTEIYLLPYYVWTDPAGARSLMEHRYHCLGAARRKAREKGYEGAMYPWQTAWLTDTETSVNQFMADFEHHVTADVAYGVHYYYEVTHDMDYMLRCGCEILFETAKFWRSRLEYNPDLDRYEIRNVIGPDEYTHEADNNAFTNYLAHLNLELAVHWYGVLERGFPEHLKRLDGRLSLRTQLGQWENALGRLYLPEANARGILPQDDTFLSLPEIDLTPYRSGLRKVKQDYPDRSYRKLQVAKQADVAVLFWLLEDQFSGEVKKNSFYYYEQRCVHESSLSLCTYSILAADLGEDGTAYELYRRACRIDLGQQADSSDAGIHAASIGGIWQCAVIGFLGVRLYRHRLRIKPRLPVFWREAGVRIIWRGQPIRVRADHKEMTVEALDQKPLPEILTGRGLWAGGTAVYREVYGDER